VTAAKDEKAKAAEETEAEQKADDAAAEEKGEDAAGDEKAEQTAADQQKGGEPAAEEQSEEPAAEEQPAEPEEQADEPAAEADEEEGGEAAQDGDQADPMEGLDWKARRRLLRSRESGAAQPQRSAEERAGQRAEQQRAARAERGRHRASVRRRRERGDEGTPPAERRSVPRKVRQGRVVSDKAEKTITVRIDLARRHPAYEKVVRRSRTLHAHDERNEANEGDLVRVVETRPLSRRKRWRLVEVLEKAK
jgi:small subunit ribosomal protein S17